MLIVKLMYWLLDYSAMWLLDRDFEDHIFFSSDIENTEFKEYKNSTHIIIKHEEFPREHMMREAREQMGGDK